MKLFVKNSTQLIVKSHGEVLIEQSLFDKIKPILTEYYSPNEKPPIEVYSKLYKVYLKNYRIYDLCPTLLLYKLNTILPKETLISIDVLYKVYPNLTEIEALPKIFKPSLFLEKILEGLYEKLSPYLPKLSELGVDFWRWVYNTLYLLNWDKYYKISTYDYRVAKECRYLTHIYQAFIVPCVDSEDKIPLVRNLTSRLASNLKNCSSSDYINYISTSYLYN